MDDDDEDEDEDGDGDPDAPPAPAAPLLLTSASSTSASHCWPQPPPTSTAAEKWASESASRVTSGNSAEAARQPLQGFGTSCGNEHMQAVREKTTESPTSSLAQTDCPLKNLLACLVCFEPKS
ncbi:uncharacterized protein J5M81_001662 [Pluvialis apricaria]